KRSRSDRGTPARSRRLTTYGPARYDGESPVIQSLTITRTQRPLASQLRPCRDRSSCRTLRHPVDPEPVVQLTERMAKNASCIGIKISPPSASVEKIRSASLSPVDTQGQVRASH